MFLTLCLIVALSAAEELGGLELPEQELTDLSWSQSAADWPLVRARRSAVNATTTNTTKPIQSTNGKREEEEGDDEGERKPPPVSKKQRLAIILNKMQKNLNELKAFFIKPKRSKEDGKLQSGRRRKSKRSRKRSKEDDENLNSEGKEKEDAESSDISQA